MNMIATQRRFIDRTEVILIPCIHSVTGTVSGPLLFSVAIRLGREITDQEDLIGGKHVRSPPCSWSLRYYTCDIKIDVNICEPHYVNFFFFL